MAKLYAGVEAQKGLRTSSTHRLSARMVKTTTKSWKTVVTVWMEADGNTQVEITRNGVLLKRYLIQREPWMPRKRNKPVREQVVQAMAEMPSVHG